jgi:hypothetical protein
MAAFGLPTMKRGAINAIDWFSVMVLTLLAALVWLFWIAKLTGWPAQLAKNALKLVPGFKPEFGIVAFIVAAAPPSAGSCWCTGACRASRRCCGAPWCCRRAA